MEGSEGLFLYKTSLLSDTYKRVCVCARAHMHATKSTDKHQQACVVLIPPVRVTLAGNVILPPTLCLSEHIL